MTSSIDPIGVEGSPFDTGASAATRFLIELVAWVAGPWAVASITETGWLAVPALAVLMGLPSIFNTPGDKRVTGVPTPGPLRLLIEALLTVAAVAGAWLIWPPWAAVLVSLLAAAMVATGRRRYRWLGAGAPPVSTGSPPGSTSS